MKRNMFGDPRPHGFDEIVEAMEERGIDPAASMARIDEPEDDGYGTYGYSAEILGDDEPISTLAYPDRTGLVADLEAAGIIQIEDV